MLPGKAYGPEEILAAAWRRKWIILVPFVLMTTVTIAVTMRIPNVYRSQTLILVVPQRVPETYVRSTVTTRIEDRLRSISQQILSRTRLERVIHDFNLYAQARKTAIMEDVVERMRRNIDVQTVRGDAFSVSFIADDPTMAMKVTERLASMFIEENLRDREVLAEGTSQFLESQLDQARQRLIEHEKKLEGFKREHAGRLPTQAEANLRVITSSQMQAQGLMESINRDRDRRLVIERSIADLVAVENAAHVAAAASGPPPEASPAATTSDQLAAARQALRGLQLRLTPEHPDVLRAQRIVDHLEAKLQGELAAAPPSEGQPVAPGTSADRGAASNAARRKALDLELEQLERHIAHREAEHQRLMGVVAEYQRRIEAAPGLETQLTELTRDYATLQAVYSSLLAKKEESQMSANLERRQIGEQFKILDPARLPERPHSPDRPKLILMGALFGLALGVGLAGLFEYRDQSFRTEEEIVGSVALPVIAVIPLMLDPAPPRRGRVTAAIAVALVMVAGAAVWTLFR